MKFYISRSDGIVSAAMEPGKFYRVEVIDDVPILASYDEDHVELKNLRTLNCRVADQQLWVGAYPGQESSPIHSYVSGKGWLCVCHSHSTDPGEEKREV